ncbi:hypothetical protein Btru_044135 [Bulinus truncatus]|nr:hypothetical protein Btru_044135 [Bulinus truncatus]
MFFAFLAQQLISIFVFDLIEFHGVMSYLAWFCTCVAIATLQHGGADDSSGSPGAGSERLTADHLGSSMVSTSDQVITDRRRRWSSPQHGSPRVPEVTGTSAFGTGLLRHIRKRQASYYGHQAQRARPTPTPVQEKFFREQIKTLPAASRDRLKQLYGSIGFTTEFQETLMQELVGGSSPRSEKTPLNSANLAEGPQRTGSTQNTGQFGGHSVTQARSGSVSPNSPPGTIHHSERFSPTSGQRPANVNFETAGNLRGIDNRVRSIEIGDKHNLQSTGNRYLSPEYTDASPLNGNRLVSISGGRVGQTSQQNVPMRLTNSYELNKSNQQSRNYLQGQSSLNQRNQQNVPENIQRYQSLPSNSQHQQSLLSNSQHEQSVPSSSQHQQSLPPHPQYQQSLHTDPRYRQSSLSDPHKRQNIDPHNRHNISTTGVNRNNQNRHVNFHASEIPSGDRKNYPARGEPQLTLYNHNSNDIRTRLSMYPSQPMKETILRPAINTPRTAQTSPTRFNDLPDFNLQGSSVYKGPQPNENLLPPTGYPYQHQVSSLSQNTHSHPQQANKANTFQRPTGSERLAGSDAENTMLHNSYIERPTSQSAGGVDSVSQLVSNNSSLSHKDNNVLTTSHPVNPIPPLETPSQSSKAEVVTITTLAPIRTAAPTTTASTAKQPTPAAPAAMTTHPPPIVDFLNTKIIIPPHINSNPAMRAAFINVLTRAMKTSSGQQRKQGHPTASSTTEVGNRAGGTYRPTTTKSTLEGSAFNSTTTTTTTTTSTTTTTVATPLYNEHVEMTPALFLTWSLPQAQISRLRGSPLSTILGSINSSRSEQLPGNSQIETFKTFLIETLLSDPTSYAPSFGVAGSPPPQTFYERLDHGPTILVKDLVGGFVRLDGSEWVNRLKRNVARDTTRHKDQTLKARVIKALYRTHELCEGLSKCHSMDTLSTKLKDRREQMKNSSLALHYPTVPLLLQHYPDPRIEPVSDRSPTSGAALRENLGAICAYFESASQRNKCVINLRKHHVHRSQVHCKKVLNADKKSKCKESVARGAMKRARVLGEYAHDQKQCARKTSSAVGCSIQERSQRRLIKRAAHSAKDSHPVLKFTWLLPKNSFPASPLDTMQFIMSKYNKRESAKESSASSTGTASSVTVNSSTAMSSDPVNGSLNSLAPHQQQDPANRDHISYLNKLIEAANALSKLQGQSVELLANSLNFTAYKGMHEKLVIKSNAKEVDVVNTPPMQLDPPLFIRMPKVTMVTPTTPPSQSTIKMNHKDATIFQVHEGVAGAMTTTPFTVHVRQGQQSQMAHPLPHSQTENFMLAMSSRFKEIPSSVLRSLVDQILQQAQPGYSTSASLLPPLANQQPQLEILSSSGSVIRSSTSIESGQPTFVTGHVPTTTGGPLQSYSPVTPVTATTGMEPPSSFQMTTTPINERASQQPFTGSWTPTTPGHPFTGQTVLHTTTPTYRYTTHPFSTTSLFSNKYVTMNLHFKSLPPLEVTTLPTGKSAPDAPVIPTSASPADVAEFMSYLMHMLKVSGQIPTGQEITKRSTAPPNVNMSLPSLEETLFQRTVRSDFESPPRPFHNLTSSNPLENSVIEKHRPSLTPLSTVLKSNPSLESLLFPHNVPPETALIVSHPTPVLEVAAPQSPEIHSGTTQPWATPPPPTTGGTIDPQVIRVVSAALNNLLTSHTATDSAAANNRLAHADNSLASAHKYLAPTSDPLAPPYNNPAPTNSVMKGVVEEASKNFAPNIVPLSQPNFAPGSNTHESNRASSTVCPGGGDRMSCKPSRPSQRLVAFCQERCDELSGVCSSALCTCECAAQTPDLRSKSAHPLQETMALGASDDRSKPITLTADGLLISMTDPEITTTTPAPASATTVGAPTEERLRKFLNLMEKVKGKKTDTAEEAEAADK